MVSHIFLASVVQRIVEEIDQHSVKLENLLAARAAARRLIVPTRCHAQ